MTNIQPTEAQKAKIEELLTAPYPVTLATAAKALETTEEEAAKLLPEGMARFVTGDASERFDEVWERLALWEKVTLFIVHDDHVFESSPRGSAPRATTTSSARTRRSAGIFATTASARSPS